MKHTLTLFIALLFAPVGISNAADSFIIENGQPRAEIIIAEKPERTVRLAAQELQDYLEKISGARLPIVTKPTGKAVKIFVGASSHSPIKAEGLKDGAYRIASLERRTAEHQKKLSDYFANPHAFDHKGFLKNAPTPEIRQSIIDGRARHLQGEIDNFNKKIGVLRGLLGGG